MISLLLSTIVGTATVYHPWYTGRITACGDRYNPAAVSAASGSLPCGAVVQVRHGNRTLNVPITDRCDCFLDLSEAAAHQLRVPHDGIGQVRVRRIR